MKKSLQDRLVSRVRFATSFEDLCKMFPNDDPAKISRALLKMRGDGKLTVYVSRAGLPASVAPSHDTRQKVFAKAMREFAVAKLMGEEIAVLESQIAARREYQTDLLNRAQLFNTVALGMPPGLQPLPKEAEDA